MSQYVSSNRSSRPQAEATPFLICKASCNCPTPCSWGKFFSYPSLFILLPLQILTGKSAFWVQVTKQSEPPKRHGAEWGTESLCTILGWPLPRRHSNWFPWATVALLKSLSLPKATHSLGGERREKGMCSASPYNIARRSRA